MKLKLRVTSLLALFAVCCIFVAFQLFIKLDSNVGENHNMEKKFKDNSIGTHQERNIHRTSELSQNVTDGDLPLPNKSSPNSDSFSPWEVWSSWVQPTEVFPINSFYSSEMDHILLALSSYRVTKFSVGYRGTQLKAMMHLSGDQRTVFKPKR